MDAEQITADARMRIARAARTGDEEQLAEVQRTMARLTVHELRAGTADAIEFAQVSSEAEDALRGAIARRVYATARNRQSWRNAGPPLSDDEPSASGTAELPEAS